MNNKLSKNELTREIHDVLNEHRSGTLATVLGDYPRSSPVIYFTGNDMDIYILSAGGDKFRAIEKNNNVCFLVNTEYIDYKRIKGLQVFGKAITSTKDSSIMEEAKKYIYDKHLLEQHEDIKIIKVIPEEIVYLDSLQEGNRTKQILKNGEVQTKDADF
ncbi:pyridoxamine 5'-phosphate oxidase family protein [Clostridium sp. D2Q-11]|uniref:Pyridoxamine 5'-phosphate oxidase family protein n=1 Tax=Anaeromonas frigoriresistens TaxID=2683708 RepID=A0A942UWQ1_9FIRM|nr:pyridoxamine 5'-phosphate oxidase family protein [Anaeromonas frigoriresistens]MBS4539490.1 pyridoxamine 5'-phosphate oxidase family protein [Anaeromonas frigoriresistens]